MSDLVDSWIKNGGMDAVAPPQPAQPRAPASPAPAQPLPGADAPPAPEAAPPPPEAQQQPDVRTQLLANAVSAVGTPDQNADHQKTAAAIGVPAPVVAAYPDAAKQAQQAQHVAAVTKANPTLGDWLSNPLNYSVAHDDLNVLSWWDQLHQGLAATFNAASQAATAAGRGVVSAAENPQRTLDQTEAIGQSAGAHAAEGWNQGEAGELAYKAMLGNASPAEQSRLQQLQAAKPLPEKSWLDPAAAMVSGMAYNTLKHASTAATVTAAGVGVGAATGASVGALGGPAAPATIPGGLIAGAAAALPDAVGAGVAASQFEGMYRQNAGLAYEQFSAIKDVATGQPVDPAVARGAAVSVGLINAGLATMGEGLIAHAIPGLGKFTGAQLTDAIAANLSKPSMQAVLKNIGAKYAQGVGGNALIGGAMEAINQIGAELSKDLSPGAFEHDKPAEVAGKIAEGAATQAKAAAVLGGAGIAAHEGLAAIGVHTDEPSILDTAQRIGQAKYLETTLNAIADNADSSKLKARLPESYQNYVDAVTKDGPLESAYVDAQKFAEHFQAKGLDPYQVADSLKGVGSDKLQLALAGGGDLEVPTSTFAAQLAGQNRELLDHTRFDPNGMTPAQGRDLEANAPSLMAEAKTLTEQAQNDRQSLEGQDRSVIDNVQSQLEARGMEPGAAEKNAILHWAFLRTMAGRVPDESVESLQERYGVKIPGLGDMAPAADGGRSLEQARAAGYGGEDRGEAAEWVAARAKGLPMDEASRMARAKAMGFDTSTKFYRGSMSDEERAGEGGFPETWITKDRNEANGYAGGSLDEEGLPYRDVESSGGNVIPLFVRGRLVSPDSPEYQAAYAAQAGHESLLKQGIVGTIDEHGRAGVFDQTALRSVHAAFDPDHSQSANLLHQSSAPGVEAEDQTAAEDKAESSHIDPETGLKPDELAAALKAAAACAVKTGAGDYLARNLEMVGGTALGAAGAAAGIGAAGGTQGIAEKGREAAAAGQAEAVAGASHADRETANSAFWSDVGNLTTDKVERLRRAGPNVAGAVADMTGVPERFLKDLVQQESGGDPDAKAATSSATGLTQFTDSTWSQMVQKYGAELGYDNIDPHSAEALQLRHDPHWAMLMGAELAHQNAAEMEQSLGRAPNQGEVYLAHFMGTGQAVKLIEAAQHGAANAAALFPKEAESNRGVFFNNGKPRSAAEVIARQTKGFSKEPF